MALFQQTSSTVCKNRVSSPSLRRTLGAGWLAPVLIISLLVVGTASCQIPQDIPSSNEAAPRTWKILPWVEANHARNDERVITGLRAWRRMTDTAIVSTMPGRADLYRKLEQRLPGMRIIPGLKLNGGDPRTRLLPTFDSVEGWQAVADEVRAICAASGQRRVLIDNETAIKVYRRGKQTINLDRLRRGLRQLPPDIEIIWYQSILGHSVEVQKRYEDVCRAVADVCNVRFTDRWTQTPEAIHDKWLEKAHHTLLSISSPTLPMLYAYSEDSGTLHWPDSRIREGLEHVHQHWGSGAEVIIYPGFARWVESAHSIRNALAHERRSPKP